MSNESNKNRNLDLSNLIEMKFKCLKCGKCCIETQMPLSMIDISRIEDLGYKKSEFTIKKDGVYILRNVNGHCYFLDINTMKCKIYQHRPIGCRIYPVVYINYGLIGIDDECPSSKTVTSKEIYRKKAKLMMLIREVEKLRRK
ncbi:MAG: YkgJ family cysteine cluster protein [Candidatus Methanomethylicia archaeon]|nr:YkgJ family cysteine cluster protein [Candidatus Methanomethylicia archaeon]